VAARTSAALGPKAPQIRAHMAKSLGLADPGDSWHAERGRIQAIAAWATRLATACAKMAEDLLVLCRSDVAEVVLGGTGGSSTMPQKQNPVAPSAIVALAHQIVALNGVLQGAGLHREARDGAAWFAEWLCLPQLCLGAASALHQSAQLAQSLAPQPARMHATLAQGLGLIHAEALSFRLAETLPRPAAQEAVKALCQSAMASQTPLAQLAQAAHPDIALDDIFDPAQQMGQAPEIALRFAQNANQGANQGPH